MPIPRFPAGPGQVKVPAAWLIGQAGFGKGYPGPGGARISTKHTLALVNPGGATAADIAGLAREIRDQVRDAARRGPGLRAHPGRPQPLTSPLSTIAASVPASRNGPNGSWVFRLARPAAISPSPATAASR